MTVTKKQIEETLTVEGAPEDASTAKIAPPGYNELSEYYIKVNNRIANSKLGNIKPNENSNEHIAATNAEIVARELESAVMNKELNEKLRETDKHVFEYIGDVLKGAGNFIKNSLGMALDPSPPDKARSAGSLVLDLTMDAINISDSLSTLSADATEIELHQCQIEANDMIVNELERQLLEY